MTELSYSQARSRTESYIEGKGIEHHMYYGPISGAYWTALTRLLLVNLRPYGEEKLGRIMDVDKDELLMWFHDKRYTRTRTVRNSLMFCSTLLDVIQSVIPMPDKKLINTLRSNRRDIELLKDTLEHICYYNIIPTAASKDSKNSKSEQNRKDIAEFITSELSQYILNELNALDPHIIVISGTVALNVFRQLGLIPADFEFQEVRKINNIIYTSIRDTARPEYEPWAKAISSSVALMTATAI